MVDFGTFGPFNFSNAGSGAIIGMGDQKLLLIYLHALLPSVWFTAISEYNRGEESQSNILMTSASP